MTAFYLDNDHALDLQNLRNGATGEYINDATVQATLLDAAGDQVAGQSWPTVLTYRTGTPGCYRSQINDDVSVALGDAITAQITAQVDGLTATWALPLTVTARR